MFERLARLVRRNKVEYSIKFSIADAGNLDTQLFDFGFGMWIYD